MFETIVRERLIELRNKAGYSQRKIEELTGISAIKIAKIEAGSQKPDIETIGELAEFYGTTIDYIFGVGKKEE